MEKFRTGSCRRLDTFYLNFICVLMNLIILNFICILVFVDFSLLLAFSQLELSGLGFRPLDWMSREP